mmetsp:Transcript_5426/g.7552  ORF Transcript_5426/g.7552 Transcript_5426/m.7552 type:complete len:138 (+) Transcript_5426:125-538(+)|eukprot:CAMPEP_0184487120 /NCGR_PEP_ID=MMETSP0113_2-20130426/9267_1 /TAXON_ID=91329 /ORGANISM="Norrisiella sphaerica, Strain BC52" /LENGTH=137 /DNA_ID=CAMNT_0026869303 /DNA_START=113 /DNA_END=526 /DNA_ORIENTATION=+
MPEMKERSEPEGKRGHLEEEKKVSTPSSEEEEEEKSRCCYYDEDGKLSCSGLSCGSWGYVFLAFLLWYIFLAGFGAVIMVGGFIGSEVALWTYFAFFAVCLLIFVAVAVSFEAGKQERRKRRRREQMEMLAAEEAKA